MCHARQQSSRSAANRAKSCAPMNLNVASSEFMEAPCPCRKCKERAREQQEARIKAIANNPNGICDQSMGRGCMGIGMGMGAGPQSSQGYFSQGPSTSARSGCGGGRPPMAGMGQGGCGGGRPPMAMGQGGCGGGRPPMASMGQGGCGGGRPPMAMGQGGGPAMGPGGAPAMTSGCGGPAMGPGGAPPMRSGCGGRGMGPGYGLAMGPGAGGTPMGIGCGMQTMGPGAGGPPMGIGCGMQTMGPGGGGGPPMGIGCGMQTMEPGAGGPPMGVGCGMQTMGPGGGPQAMGTGMEPGGGPAMGIGCGVQTMGPGGFQRQSMGPNGASATEPGGLAFGQLVAYGRKSSTNEAIQHVDFGAFGAKVPTTGARYGRDTLGLLVHLRGTRGLLNAVNRGTCDRHADCDQHCGIDTECSVFCKRKSDASYGHGSESCNNAVGFRICCNENINMCLNYLLEVVGILLFFAICTIVFWLKVGYHIVQLIINLIYADRNVKVAIGVVFAMLLLAFAISQATSPCGSKNCQNAIQSNIATAITKCSKYKKALPNLSGKKTCAVGKLCSAKGIRDRLKAWLPWWFGQHRAKGKAVGIKVPRKYTDHQGRQIFDASRRTAVLTEMKQPPAWIVWLHDTFYRT